MPPIGITGAVICLVATFFSVAVIKAGLEKLKALIRSSSINPNTANHRCPEDHDAPPPSSRYFY